MRIRMLETRRGTEDGFIIRQYKRGETYNVANGMGYAFLAAGFAVKCPEPIIQSSIRRHNKRITPDK